MKKSKKFEYTPFFIGLNQSFLKRICKKNNALFILDVTEWYGTSGNGYVTSLVKWIDTSLRMRVVNFLADGLITTSTYLTEFYKSKVNNIIELPTLYDKIALKNNVEYFQKNDQKIKRILYAGNPFSANTSKNSKSGVKERLDKVIALLGKVENKNFILDIYGVDKNRYLEVYPDHADLLYMLNGQIIFNGRRAHSEVINAIANSDFTIFFRDTNRVTKAGFPSKYSESIANQYDRTCPVISKVADYQAGPVSKQVTRMVLSYTAYINGTVRYKIP